MKYTASYDMTVKVITGLIIALMLALIIYNICEIARLSDDIWIILTHLFVIFVLVIILLICYIYSPQYYNINDESLIIKRIIKDRTIMLNDISEIRLLEPKELSGVIRTFGVGGLFGYFGKFSSLKLGSMNWYATQRKNKVLVILKTGKKIVITPDDRSLIDKIRSKNS